MSRFILKNFMVYLLTRIIMIHGVIYTYEDVELRRIFANEFPQDIIRRSGSLYPEQLGRYKELKSYFENPKSKLNAHFEELLCYHSYDGQKVCKIDWERLRPEEVSYYNSDKDENHIDNNRVYCFMLLCFTEDELDNAVGSF